MYSQICGSTELYLLGTVSSPIDPQHLLANLAHGIFGTVTEQLQSLLPEYSEDIKCPIAGVDYLVYYLPHSIPAKIHLLH